MFRVDCVMTVQRYKIMRRPAMVVKILYNKFALTPTPEIKRLNLRD